MVKISILALSGLLVSGCMGGGGTAYPEIQPRPGQGQYIRPAYLNPQPLPQIPPVDSCRSQLYQGLLGQHEGAIYISGLPGRKRVLKPAFEELEPDTAGFGQYAQPPRIQVRDYIPDQVLYAPSIRTVSDRIQLGPDDPGRLTIELDVEGYVQEIRCA